MLHFHYLCFINGKLELSAYIREKGLKVTPARLSVTKVLADSHLAYSHAELEDRFGDMDRVTLYRVLNDLEQAGLVHKIIDMDSVTRFALCKHSCPGEHHAEDHVHFNCRACHKMFCLEKVQAPVMKVPQGFKAAGANTLIYGVCSACNAA